MLYIAEKPSLAKAIANGLRIKQKHNGYFDCQSGDQVTWCYGHLLQQFDPEQYDKNLKQWRENTLPFIPDTWMNAPKSDAGAKRQLKVIQSLLRSTKDAIVNAGDPDREGQLLVDEILEYFNNKKKVKRVLIASLDEESVSESLSSLKDNMEFQTWKQAAEARSRADWLVGINLTRAMTLSGQRHGLSNVLSIGRVQTPTLSLVVQRDREIENFKPKSFFIPKILIHHENGDFLATWVTNDKYDIDPEGQIIKKEVAENIVANLKGQQGIILQVKNQKKKVSAPKPFSLSTLQSEASKKLSMSAKETLDTAQSLYEKKLTTYPRSDCQFLPEEQFKKASKILKSLSNMGINGAEQANPSIHNSVWNTTKITAHHAIIPTGVTASLSGREQKFFNLIAERYICQFYPPMEYLSQQVIVECGNEKWKATGSQLINPGWTVCSPGSKKIGLPDMKERDTVTCKDTQIDDKQTKPPSRFTDGTLISAMNNIYKFTSNPQIKALLKENSGIGTEATRANIIELLIHRQYLKKNKKQIISTPLGRSIIDVVPPALSDPGTTALWEDFLKDIEQGKRSVNDFMNQQAQNLPKLVQFALNVKFPKSITGDIHKCPECQAALKRYPSKKKKGVFYWACFRSEAHKDQKPVFFPDDNGKPGKDITSQNTDDLPKAPCPEKGCGEQMVRRQSKKNKDFYFWVCPNEEHALRFDDNGKPGEKMEFNKKVKKKTKRSSRKK